jgi:hypothetical protein
MLLVRPIVGRLMGSGILPEYQLAAKLQLELGDTEDRVLRPTVSDGRMQVRES